MNTDEENGQEFDDIQKLCERYRVDRGEVLRRLTKIYSAMNEGTKDEQCVVNSLLMHKIIDFARPHPVTEVKSES